MSVDGSGHVFVVHVREIHIRKVRVEASDPSQATSLVAEGHGECEDGTELESVLDPETWTVMQE